MNIHWKALRIKFSFSPTFCATLWQMDIARTRDIQTEKLTDGNEKKLKKKTIANGHFANKRISHTCIYSHWNRCGQARLLFLFKMSSIHYHFEKNGTIFGIPNTRNVKISSNCLCEIVKIFYSINSETYLYTICMNAWISALVGWLFAFCWLPSFNYYLIWDVRLFHYFMR